MTCEKSITLHQQDGGMSVQAFADMEGLTLKQARYCIKRGKVLGARKDSRSKHWWIYPPAKLMERPRSRKVCIAESLPLAPAALPDLLLRGSADTGEAGTESGQSGQPAPQVEAEGKRPPAKPVLTLEAAALPGAARSLRAWPPASCGKSDVYTESRSVCQVLREAALKRHREGIHYLRLTAHELAQLYVVMNSDRSRVRKLVGRGLLPIGLLRASDSVWQKLQAMSQQGRLL